MGARKNAYVSRAVGHDEVIEIGTACRGLQQAN